MFFPPVLSRNTFVLEYCGEVLDHKEFKARVKEYARNKNIHYYFMALKNDEVSREPTKMLGIQRGWLVGLAPTQCEHPASSEQVLWEKRICLSVQQLWKGWSDGLCWGKPHLCEVLGTEFIYLLPK